jgi:hypothetical protein
VQHSFVNNAAQKAKQFEQSILDTFQKRGPKVDQDDLQNYLEETMMTTFETDCDDGSIDRVCTG